MAARIHQYDFSHEFEDGPSGGPRSYWDIERNGKHITTLCLQPKAGGQPEETARRICFAMDDAFEAGRKDKAKEMRKVLGL